MKINRKQLRYIILNEVRTLIEGSSDDVEKLANMQANLPDQRGLGDDKIDELARIIYDSKGLFGDEANTVYMVVELINKKAHDPKKAARRLAKRFRMNYKKPLDEYLKSFMSSDELRKRIDRGRSSGSDLGSAVRAITSTFGSIQGMINYLNPDR